METELLLVGTLPQGSVFNGPLANSFTGTPSSFGDGVLLSVCSTGRLVAFVSSNYHAQFISRDVDPNGQSQATTTFLYSTAFQGILDIAREPMSTKSRPQATAVLTLPIAFTSRSGVVQRSSVVLIGFSDGHIRGYSKSGQRVLSHLMHTEPVKRLTCMAALPSQRGSTNQCNVVVSYPDHVCVVEGESLVNMIKTYAQSRSSDEEAEEVILGYKKWKIFDQTTTLDVALLGHSTPSAFDHLCEASSVGGFETTLRSTPGPEALLITVGESPMIALYKITKDAGHLNMSEVVHAVASKMTSAVLGKISQASGWLGWGKKSSSPTTKAPPKEKRVQLSTNLPMSTNVPDIRRSVLSITVSPQGNLAALVDCFGRVLLLECENLIVRRMWKGYRDAQCGWLLVGDSPNTSGRTERGKRKRPSSQSSPHTKTAQCLCIYAPRRGIVELWPVQTGSRVAVFQVGKDCQLLYSPHPTFTFDLTNEEMKAIKNEKGIRDTVLLLCPDGQLVTFVVPFPLLTRLGDPSSFDVHLMKKLPQAIQAGDSELLVQVFSGLKSSQTMKQAIDTVIGAQHTQSIPHDLILKLLNIATERVDGSDPAMYRLFCWVSGVRQAVELLQGVEQLTPTDTPTNNKLEETLQSLCGLPPDRGGVVSASLSYFNTLSHKKTVIKNIDLKSFIKCFDLPRKVGNMLLSSSKSMGGEDGGHVTRSLSRTQSTYPVKLSLREGLVTATLLDIGSALFLKLLTRDVADHSISTLFQTCGLSTKDLLRLLCLLCVSGGLSESDPVSLVRRLHKLLKIITALPSSEVSPLSSLTQSEEDQAGDQWAPIIRQCMESSNVGHALLVVLVCQQFASVFTEESMESGDQGWESWEPVSSDSERWITLTHQLEVLTFLSNLIGRNSLTHLPQAVYGVVDSEDDKETVNLNNLFPFNSEQEAVCAGSLEKYGHGVITHCVAMWLVTNHIPAEFVARIPLDPHDNDDPNHSKLVFQLSPLLKLLPHTLSHQSLLLHCAWQGVHCAMQGVTVEPAITLEHLSHVTSCKTVAGMVGVLWHCVYENQVLSIIESLKRGGVIDQRLQAALSVCRNLFSWLYKLCCHSDELCAEEAEESEHKDLIPLSNPPGIVSLPELTRKFPLLSPTVVKTYLELLLLTELSVASSETVTLTTLFPTWLRGALKKGAYKSAWQEQVPVQLQQKRTKYLCEAVKMHLSSNPPPSVPPTLASQALSHTSSTLGLEVASHRDIVFLLAELWGLEGDTVRRQWVNAFFAAGMAENGTEAFMEIKDKSRASQELVSFSAQLCDHLLQRVESKSHQLALMAQVSPSLLEYFRNQGKRPFPSVCSRLEPSWIGVSKLVSLIQPYVATKTSMASILTALSQFVQKCTID